MTKYDVELITDKHGKPMPQYFDDQEGIMKPITKDNFDGTINGSVDVEFPDLQRVEVTNAQTQMDVNVLNPVDNVSVNNLPTDYPDQAVEARLQAIEQTQSQILDKLNDTIDTQLTGSNVEQKVVSPVKIIKERLTGVTIAPGKIEKIKVRAEQGYLYEVENLSLDFRGSDNITIEIGIDGTAALSDRFLEMNSASKMLSFIYGSLLSGTYRIPKSENENVIERIRSIKFSNDRELVISILNKSETEEVNIGIVNILIKKTKVV